MAILVLLYNSQMPFWSSDLDHILIKVSWIH